MGHVNTRDEVLEAFTVFDAGRKGHLTRAELQRVLSDLGEMISPQEAQQMLQTVAGNDGNIYYTNVVQQWFAYDR
jgi:Ca2+-binding EF-hand superfamily protein